MKKNNLFVKKVVVGILSVALISLSVITTSVTTQAEESDVYTDETTKVTYILDASKYDFQTFWEERKAPIKEGYIFGGWYTKSGDVFSPVLESKGETISEAYAKFVPAYVLSIKAQNEEGTSVNDGKNSSVRIISSVDALSYKEVGFDILLNNKISIGECKSADVYSYLKNDENDTEKRAQDEFGAASTHFSVWRLDNINNKNDSKIIYARPYWVTMDGTKVEGLAKYVHIEDGYMNYISVPINLLTGEHVAVGKLEMKYDAEVLSFHDFEAGKLLTEMNENHKTSGSIGSIMIVGNAVPTQEGLYEEVSADGIFANVRFTVNEGKDANGTELDMIAGDFCDWSENIINTVTAWDVICR